MVVISTLDSYISSMDKRETEVQVIITADNQVRNTWGYYDKAEVYSATWDVNFLQLPTKSTTKQE